MSFVLNIAYRDGEFPRLDKDILLPLVQKIDSRISEVVIIKFDLANPMAFQMQNIETEDAIKIPDDTAEKLEAVIIEQAKIQEKLEKNQ